MTKKYSSGLFLLSQKQPMKRILCVIYLASVLAAPLTAHARRLFYAEEFYLYVLNLYQTNPSLERNIRFMQWALEAPFENPVRSLAVVKTEADFARYKALFRMHVNLLIIESYLLLGRRFDKEHVYFFNLWYAESLKDSFQIAEYFYTIGFNYWDEVLRYAGEADAVPGRISIDAWEDELQDVLSGKLDYVAIISRHLEKLSARMAIVEDYLRSEAEEN
jgi:hypothetical protein